MRRPGTGFEKAPLFLAIIFSYFCVFLAEQWNHDVIASSKTGILPNCLRELSLKSLTLKTVMLFALASAQRQQTLSALDLNLRKESQDPISFVVTDRLKTSRPGKSIEITFSSSGCASICPLAALKEYISRSETLRFRSGHFVSKLFLSFIRPYNPSVP